MILSNLAFLLYFWQVCYTNKQIIVILITCQNLLQYSKGRSRRIHISENSVHQTAKQHCYSFSSAPEKGRSHGISCFIFSNYSHPRNNEEYLQIRFIRLFDFNISTGCATHESMTFIWQKFDIIKHSASYYHGIPQVQLVYVICL